MNEAPKKIYLANIEGDIRAIPLFDFDLKEDDYVKYIRADLVDGMREALRLARRALAVSMPIRLSSGILFDAAQEAVCAALEAGKVDG